MDYQLIKESIKDTIKNSLEKIVDTSNVFVSEPMSKHTSFRIGGPADFFVVPKNVVAIGEVIRFCREQELPYLIIGNGSNLLVRDGGIRGVVIQVSKEMNEIHIESENPSTGEVLLRAEAGCLLSKLSKVALKEGLSGLEFASGIPGTLGGAIYMNAGAYGGEMKDILSYVDVIDDSGNKLRINKDDLGLGYRRSILQKKGYIAVSAGISLNKGDLKEIEERMNELTLQRTTKQPLEIPSAGSTFKRPEGYFAGKLIMDSGLQGFSIGGAQVSEKHCGFVVNKGNATAKDVERLIRHIQEVVMEKFSVELTPEIKIVGETDI